MDTLAPADTKKRRPDFLTILCILTFIGSGFNLVSAVTNYINADVLSAFATEAIDKTKEEVGEDGDNGFAEKVISSASSMLDPVKLKQNYLLAFVANLLTLSGAILMFRLRRVGFWVYVAGTAALVVTPLIIFGLSNVVSLGISLIVGVIGILFIVLYSLNLKHLR